MGMLSIVVSVATFMAASYSKPPEGGQEFVRGMTISCQTWGREWGSDGFARELDRLQELGVNWVAIHPYAWIRADGRVQWRELDAQRPPPWISRPIREAHARGMSILVKPHLGYWGSPFSWRGAIGFEDDAAWQRFFSSYERWIVCVARAARDADAFAVGTELARTLTHEAAWRRIVTRVRAVTSAHLTYAANWTDFEQVRFWDELDAIGVQAYFPLASEPDPSAESLERGWLEILPRLKALHLATGKPVVFTELGYDRSAHAAERPWDPARRASTPSARDAELQARCLRVSLQVLEREREWLRGAFLWKWFVGPAPGANFQLDSPHLRSLIASVWDRN